MYSFKDVGIYVNQTTGLIAQNATISSSNSLSPNLSLGAVNSNMGPSGPIRNELNIEYVPKTTTDPFFLDIVRINNGIKTNQAYEEDIKPLVLQVGHISGSFFLSSFKISCSNNNIVTASASFAGYTALSGEGAPRAAQDLTNFESQYGHSWTTSIADSYLAEDSTILYSVEYSLNKALTPIYKLGSKNPTQILCGQISRAISVSLEDFKNIDYTGRSINELFNDKTDVKFQGYSALSTENSEDGFAGPYAGSGVDSILLSMEGMKVTKTSTSMVNNDIVRTSIQAESIN